MIVRTVSDRCSRFAPVAYTDNANEHRELVRKYGLVFAEREERLASIAYAEVVNRYFLLCNRDVLRNDCKTVVKC